MVGIRLGCALISNNLFTDPLQHKMPEKRKKKGKDLRNHIYRAIHFFIVENHQSISNCGQVPMSGARNTDVSCGAY